MPPAVALGVGALTAGAGAASGGKKGSSAAKKAADQQYQLQLQQLQFGKDVFNTGMTAWQPAKDYWSTLLAGDPNKVNQAVGPISQQIRDTYTGTGQAIQNRLPAGGEKNLALAQASTGQARDLAGLYSGVQPTAAAALGQLAGLPVSAGTSIMGQAAPNVSAGLKFDRAGAQMAQQGASGLGQGLGTLLYQVMQKRNAGGMSGAAGKG